jgi:hypothetical protein
MQPELPAEFISAFDGRRLNDKVGLGYVVVTVDADHVPRPAMLSAGEILVLDGAEVRIATWRGTHTGTNLREGRPAVICYAGPGSVVYVTGKPRLIGSSDDPEVDMFAVEVSSVQTDSHPGLPVKYTITFACEGMRPDELVAMWTRQLNALRQIG